MKYAQCIDTTVIVGPLIHATNYGDISDVASQYGLEMANNEELGRDLVTLPAVMSIRLRAYVATWRLFV